MHRAHKKISRIPLIRACSPRYRYAGVWYLGRCYPIATCLPMSQMKPQSSRALAAHTLYRLVQHAKGRIRASRTSRRNKPTGAHCPTSRRLHRMNPWCAPTCPPRRSFIASDARCRGQVCTVPTRPESTYRSGNAVQTTGATSDRQALAGELVNECQ